MKIKDIISEIDNLSFSQVLEYLSEKAEKKSGKTFVVSINPEIIMLEKRDKEFEHVLKSADLALNDGVGVTFAAKVFGFQLQGRVHGSDLVEKLCERVSKQPITVAFLGGYENVAEKTAERLKEKYPSLKVAFALEEWPAEKGAEVAGKISSETLRPHRPDPAVPIATSLALHRKLSGSPRPNSSFKCDILFVAFGSPKQEKWIYQNLPNLDVRVAMGVGGAFDYISGKVRRAPVWVRRLGLEWLFRLIRQPWRVKRQGSLVKFVFLVLAEKLS